ncbi:response regulator transcription factor [Clostridium oceanicum]|uniref:Stage 0 sporulation protein A homolog n=1 Tax=Clostridium oceanicum TaxID=1543 RepID=A0ABN1JG34_9CLOT
MKKYKILLVEDEESIRDILSYSLKKEGYYVIEAPSGEDGINKFEENDIDLIILDLMLPGISGFEVCKTINSKYKVPIIMLTAKNDIVDKVLGLEFGADDYITKPFDIREVLARVKVCLRRIEELNEIKDKDNSELNNTIQIKDNIKMFKDRRQVIKNDINIELKPKEFDLLCFLAENKNVVFSRENLIEKIWGYDFFGDTRTVDVHIQRLRKKLDDSSEESIIKTLFGVGYKMI